jgi:ribonuclease D
LYIRTAPELDCAIESLLAAPVVAIDTEFMRERTYFARLCLVQAATAEEVFLIDAIELGDAIAPLARVLEAPGIVKVFHAAQQDVEVLLRATRTAPAPLFDTQVAATLAGFPTQVGYGQLVKDLLGVTIDKSDTFTDWAARPLSETQLSYAAADVRHLIVAYEMLRSRLEREGRLGWLAEDFERLADPATYAADPREQWRRVKRASSLDARSLAVLREVAAWREPEAQRRDLPKRWLISDESLIEIARRRPRDAAALSSLRGVSDRVASRNSGGLFDALRAGEGLPADQLPKLPKRMRMPSDAQPVADVLSAVVRLRAKEHGVAPTLLASRDELERFASGDREGHPLSSGWRHTLVGAELEALLDGRTALRISGGRVVLSDLPAATPKGARDDDS